MGHPNEDFLKKFLASRFDQPEGQRRLPGKKEIKEQYAAGKHIVKTDKLDMFLKERSGFILSHGLLYKPNTNLNNLSEKATLKKQEQEARQEEYLKEEKAKRQQRLNDYYNGLLAPANNSNIVESTLGALENIEKPSARQTGKWIEKKTPYGIFFYNKEENVWMNTLGIIRKNFNDFFTALDTTTFSDSGTSERVAPVYDNEMTLLRFVDSDIYGFIVERNHDSFSIDNYYPEYPYTGDGTLTNFGNLFEFLNVSSNINLWDSGLAGKAFMGGAQGKRADVAGAAQYGETGSNERTWSTNWANLANDGANLASFYDIADTARRGVGSGFIYPSTLSKYQWFDFYENKVKGSIKQSIAAGYAGSSIIETGLQKINTPRTGYTTTVSNTPAVYSIFIAKPSPSSLGALNPDLISVNAQGITFAQVRELFSNDLDGDGIDDVPVDEQVRFVSLDQSVDQVIATLDENGSIRILFNNDSSAESTISRGTDWKWLVYFDKEWIAEGFLTDDEGNAVFIENENFVSVTATSGLGNCLIYVWCLHENGRLYGAELTTAVDNNAGVYSRREKFVTPGNPSSGRNPNFGTVSNLDLPKIPSGTLPDEYRQYYSYSGGGLTATGVVTNGACKEIQYVLNRIPKINGVRFPVISVYGGYHSGGVLTCVDPTYTGYLPTSQDNFNHPTQMCEIVNLLKINTFSLETERLLSKIQRYTATYNTNTQTWSYALNSNFDEKMYDTIFGVTINANGGNELVYVPPRCVSIQRIAIRNNASSLNTQSNGIIHILSNNGTWSPISGLDVYVPCRLNSTLNPNFANEITGQNRVTMQGDFTLGYTSWGYTAWGESPIFNNGANFFNGARYKFGTGPTPFTSPAGVVGACVGNFDQETMWSIFFNRGSVQSGWGNPPRINGQLMPQYGIPAMDMNTDDIFGFSIHDYFGNTGYETPPPSYLLVENNFINNDVIFDVVCYGDSAGNYPVFLNGTSNTGYTFAANNIPVLSVADDEILENPFAWIRGVGDLLYGIRFDGRIDLLSHRGADDDGFIFDPFWGPCYPQDRANPSGITFWDLRPANYDAIIDSMKKVGAYIPGTYQSYNHYLPNL